MVEKVISGAQTGADLSGLITAKKLGIKTGGKMPNGFKNHTGPHPEYAEEYGMEEHDSPYYPPRTQWNVVNSDATIRFALNFDSPGERCTLKFIKANNKPHLDINVLFLPRVEEVKQWLEDNNVKILNIAGNSEKSAPGIGIIVQKFLTEVLSSNM